MSELDPFRELREQIARVRDDVDTITRLGKITAIDAGTASATVTLSGQTVTGVRWVGSTPTVGDFVAVIRTGQAWLILGKLSRDLTGPGYVERTLTVDPDIAYIGRYWSADFGWEWFTSTTSAQQGQFSELAEVDAEVTTRGTIWLFPAWVTQIPSGATVTAARVLMARDTITGGGWTTMNTLPLVSPVIYGHARTSGPSAGQNPGDLMAAGYGPWRPGTLARGQQASWELPSGWLTAWLAGTIRGLGLWVPANPLAEDANFAPPSARLTVTYTVPA